MRNLLPVSSILLAMLLATAPGARAGDGAKETAARCEKDVRDYMQTMRYIRQAAGGAIGDRVASSVASEENVRKVAEQQGFCAAAQLIRERTANR